MNYQSAEEAVKAIKSGHRVFVHGSASTPIQLLKAHFNRSGELMHWSWSFSVYAAFALIIWIQVETIYVQVVGWLQTFYMFFAIPLIFVGLLPQVRNLYKK